MDIPVCHNFALSIVSLSIILCTLLRWANHERSTLTIDLYPCISTNPLSQEETEALQTLLAAHKDSLESLLDQLKDELSQKLAPRVKAHRDQRSQEIAALKERMKMLEMKRRTLHLQPPPSSNSSSSSNNRASASASTAAVSSSSISVLGKRPANN